MHTAVHTKQHTAARVLSEANGLYYMGPYIQGPTHNITVQQGNRTLYVEGILDWKAVKETIDLDAAFLEWEAQALSGSEGFHILA